MMTEVNFDYWLDDVVPSVIGVEVPFAMLQIREAAIAFCEKTLAWRLDALPINISVNDATYNLVSPIDKSEIVKVMSVHAGNCPLTVKSWTELMGNYRDAKIKTGDPVHYVQDYVERLTLFPIPQTSVTDGLVCNLALRPSRIADGMNGSVGKRYFQAISNGAKARLFEMPNKPWTDGQLAVFHQNKFDTACYAARDEVASGLGHGAKRVKSHY